MAIETRDEHFSTVRWNSVVSLLISVFFLFYIQKIRQYLDNIDDCKCAPLEYVHNIAKFETAFVYVLYFVCGVHLLNIVYPQWISIIYINKSIVPLVFAFTILVYVGLILLSMFFIYNVYEYYMHLLPNCSCIEEIESLMMYLQSFFYIAQYGIPFVMLVISIISLYRNRNKKP